MLNNEKTGMILEAPHNAGNRRRSNEAHLQQLQLIRHLWDRDAVSAATIDA